MKHLAHKKIVLVIVEGPSDDTALGIALSQIYDRDSVYVHIMYGDITTQKGVTSQNIVAKVGNSIRSYAKSQHYTAKDGCGLIWNIPYRVYYREKIKNF